MMDVGKIIKTKRLEVGWSQERLASEAGVSQPSIKKIESGETKHSKFLARIAHVLGLQMADLDPVLFGAPRERTSDTNMLQTNRTSVSNHAVPRHGPELVSLTNVLGREDLPVYTLQKSDQELILSKGPHTRIARPHNVTGVSGTFGLLIRGTDNVLAREFSDGDTAIVNPHRHPVVGSACLFLEREVILNTDGTLQDDASRDLAIKIGYLAKPVETSATHWHIELTNPAKRMTLSREDFPICYVLVGKMLP